VGFGSPSRISERKLREGAQLKRKITFCEFKTVPNKWPASSPNKMKNPRDKGDNESGGGKKERREGGMQTKNKRRVEWKK
jgi:hypothetical protein